MICTRGPTHLKLLATLLSFDSVTSCPYLREALGEVYEYSSSVSGKNRSCRLIRMLINFVTLSMLSIITCGSSD